MHSPRKTLYNIYFGHTTPFTSFNVGALRSSMHNIWDTFFWCFYLTKCIVMIPDCAMCGVCFHMRLLDCPTHGKNTCPLQGGFIRLRSCSQFLVRYTPPWNVCRALISAIPSHVYFHRVSVASTPRSILLNPVERFMSVRTF